MTWHPIKDFWRWHDECYFQVLPVVGALSLGEVMTVSPKVIMARLVTWVTVPQEHLVDCECSACADRREREWREANPQFKGCDDPGDWEVWEDWVEACEIEESHDLYRDPTAAIRIPSPEWDDLVHRSVLG